MESYTTVFLPILVGAVAIAVIGICQRWALQGRESPAYFTSIAYSLVAAMIAVFYVALYGLTMPAKLLPGFWNAVFVGTAANLAIQYLHAKVATLPKGEVSFVAPLQATTPGLITLLAIMLGEYPGPLGLIGIVLMAAGSWILLFPGKPEKWWHYFSPIYRLHLILRYRSLSAEEKGRAIVVWFTLLGAFLSTIGLLCDGLYTRRGVDYQGMWLALLVLLGILAIVYIAQYFFLSKATKEKSGSIRDWRFSVAILGFALAWVAALWFTTPAFNETYVAYVGTLKRMSVPIGVVLGFLIFDEKDFKKRIAVASLIVLGAILIGSEDLPTRLTSQIELRGF